MQALALFFLCWFSVSTQGIAQTSERDSAPFGLVWGMSSTEVKALGVELASQEDATHGVSYSATKLPKVLADVHMVLLSFGYDDRLWRVGAMSQPFKNDPYGAAVRSRYEELSRLLSEKYGPGKTQQMQDTRVWKSPEEFLAGIKDGRSWWFVNYETKALAIQLIIRASDMSTGFWTLIFENKALRTNFQNSQKVREKNAL